MQKVCFTQVEGTDYNETFAPVAKSEAVKIFLTIAAQKNQIVHQWDVQTAFLAGKLEETIYMEQPDGFNDGTNRVCKLKRSLYGLKQSSRCWNQKFSNYLISLGFQTIKIRQLLIHSRGTNGDYSCR